MSALTPAPLLNEVRVLIDSARGHTAATANAELTLLYWRVGRCIRAEVLGGTRAEYGQQVIASLAQALTADYGRGWSEHAEAAKQAVEVRVGHAELQQAWQKGRSVNRWRGGLACNPTSGRGFGGGGRFRSCARGDITSSMRAARVSETLR
ncbi:DUF1016 N-terminal domain-containing protein [Paraburkholderia fynbosensis]|uniref:YhcG N-terminal domain-containing protein n=1 Tax=Paraburkholderia fynbosensis TaxID=1200993 RepID=A0A6J5H4B2_9BURK|nr:DUF1016 N-terminal domain-containing protein [Paraburkholderia fynbosensis]CAB3810736.1 hypothetical protein LMG27177_07424 [Paraburkholderia fynbosensis]